MKRNDIGEEYILLFNTISDTEDQLSALNKRLIEAQQRAEEIYILAGKGQNYKSTIHINNNVFDIKNFFNSYLRRAHTNARSRRSRCKYDQTVKA